MTSPHVTRARRPSLAILAITALLSPLLTGCDGREPGGHAGHDDHGPPGASGDVAALTSEQAEAAGVETIVASPGALSERLKLTAVVRANQDAQAHITPKVPGIVRAIEKHLGDRVQAGDVVAVLESVALGEAVSELLVAKALLDAARGTLAGEEELLQRRVAIAETVFERQERLKDQEITTLRPYYEAEQALAAARLSRDSRLLELRAAVRQREIALNTAEERLHILGLDDEELERLAQTGEHNHGRYALRAPRSGVVVARDVTENEFVGTDDKLFLIQDLKVGSPGTELEFAL